MRATGLSRAWISVLGAICMVFVMACEQKKPHPPTPPPDRPAAPKPKPAPPPAEPAKPVDPSLPATSFADDAALIKALRGGGYIIAIRHTKTNMEEKDTQGEDFADCTKQRNLNDQGRADAKAMAEVFKALNLPISEVLSSPFCRNKETAELVFGKYTINKACMGEDEKSIAARATLLGTKPPAGKNLVIVTHQHSMGKSTSSDVPYFNEGAAILIVPKGGTEFEMVHTIPFEDWARLAQAAKGTP